MEKKKRDIKPFIIIALIIILGVFLYIYINLNNSQNVNNTSNNIDTSTNTVKVESKTIEKAISSNSEVQTSLNEKLSLHTTSYFSEKYFSEGDYVLKGENILKYTNGAYLTAPYNLVISEISVPSEKGICTNSNYITVYAIDTLAMYLQISESEINEVKIGQEVNITILSLNETVTGYITKISNSGTYSSKGTTYLITANFNNNGNIKLGMSGNAKIIVDKAENVLSIPTEGITTSNGKQTVNKIKYGQIKKVEVEIGISNNAYTEIKSGLNENDEIQIVEKDT